VTYARKRAGIWPLNWARQPSLCAMTSPKKPSGQALSRPLESLGGLHGMVNNAAIHIPRTLLETDAELFERHTRVNQLGCFLGMKAVVAAMERSGGGSIVNISSVARAARCAPRLCVQRDEVGVVRHDQGRRHRSRAAPY
jgi:NAD(P)-dependent dehydrogenase (short-subunit alcohol dehydrogenase family)